MITLAAWQFYALLGFLTTALLISLYVNWNLYRKVTFYENWYYNLAAYVREMYGDMKQMDSIFLGAMQNDDEVGKFFTNLQEMVKELRQMGFYGGEDSTDI